MTTDRAKVVIGAILLVAGTLSCAVVTLIVAAIVLQTATSFHWDGPLRWDRVIGCLLCPAILGTMLVPIGYSLATARRPTPPHPNPSRNPQFVITPHVSRLTFHASRNRGLL